MVSYDLVLVQLPNPALATPTMYQPLGILYLIAVARKKGYNVTMVDLRSGDKPLPDADFYGFSCTTPEVTEAKKLARKVSGITIVGGAHPSLLPDDCMFDFDYVVVGEGERLLLDILSLKLKPGIHIADRILNLNHLPFPAWKKDLFTDTLFPGERYGKGEKAATLIASRGCPFSCSFCGNTFTVPVVYRSVKNIIDEVKYLKSFGVRHFRFEDDNFTLHPQFDELCLELHDLDVRFKCHTRSDLLTHDAAALLKHAGCEEFGLGVESADNRVLRLNHKKETVEDHARAVGILKKHGIRAKTYLMAGLPGETDETIELNKQFMRKVKPDKWTLSTFTPYPGCDVYNHPHNYGVEVVDWDWSGWWNFADHFVHVLQGQTQEQMWERYKSFYEWLKEESWR
jgi:anaerobic magnesium-protoporphyrin IX monomethyl ester cyclase